MLNPHFGFNIYFVSVKIIGRIAQIFVAFSENLNLTSGFFSSLLFSNALTLKDWLEAIHGVCSSYAKPYEKLMHVLA